MNPDTPKPLDEDRSRLLAAEIDSKPHQPFANAHRGLLHLQEPGDYVQGFVVIAGSPFNPHEHAWLETEGAIVDPSAVHLQQPASALHYFPAQRLSKVALQQAIETAREDYPEDDPLPIYGDAPYAYYGDLMLGGKDYQQAHRQAEVFTQLLSQQGDQN
ncbi:MAG: hypothetical protein AAF289_01690 [Cyanobacteria bacterium P01_A01_bin.135]